MIVIPTVSPRIKRQVKRRIAYCQKKTGIMTPGIKVKYNIKNRCGGLAYCDDMVLCFNPTYLIGYTDEYIKQTVAHEWAHIAAQVKYGPDIRAHGKEWRSIMKELNLTPERTHAYRNPPNTSFAYQRDPYYVKCTVCSHPIDVGQKVHARIHNGRPYSHNDICGGQLIPL